MQFKSFMEALKGKQHKIDKNKNGQIDAHDFKLLRKEEQEIVFKNGEDDEEEDKKEEVEQIDIEESAKETAQKAINLADKLRKKDPEKSKMYRNLGIKASQRSNNPTGVKSGQPHGSGNKALRKQGIEPVPSSMSSSKMRGYFEEVEQVDEVSPPGFKGTVKGMKKHKEIDNPFALAWSMYKKGYKSHKNADGTMKEESEQIDEKSEQAKQNKTMKNMMDASRGARYKLNNPVPDAAPEHKTARAHNVAIGRALRNEDAEVLDELGPLTYASYQNKATAIGRDGTKAFDKSGKDRSAGVAKASKRTKDWAHEKGPLHKLYPAGKKSTLGKKAQAAVRANAQWNEEKKDDVPFDGPYTKVKPDTKDKSGAVHTPMSRAKHLARMAMKKQMKEDIDRLFEAKDDSEYNYEGEMAVTQLKTISRHAEALQAKMQPDTNLPEWVQSKITLATDYLQTAHDYLMSELDEQAPVAPVPDRKYIKGTPENKAYKATKKPINGHPTNKVNEEEAGNLSYKDFMEAMTATQVRPGVTRYTGGSYGSAKGAKYGNTDYDKETLDTKDDEGNDQQKRGRGRPAGAKSGARGPRIK